MREASLLHILQRFLLFASLVSVPVACFQPAPDCPNKCGNVSIPYPFGIGDDCTNMLELGGNFYVTCNETFHPPKPFLGKDNGIQFEIINISLEQGEVRVYGPLSYICFNSATNYTTSQWQWNFSGEWPYLASPRRNKFGAIGCNTLAYFGGQASNQSYYTGCVSYCRGGVESAAVDGAPCTGMGCCEASIPNGLGYMNFSWGYDTNGAWDFSPCSYAMLAEEDWYNFSRQDLLGYLGYFNRMGEWSVPLVLDWAIRNGSCPQGDQKKPDNYACVSKNSYCVNATNGPGYLCNCSHGYQGNPYILDGCQDINECKRSQDPAYEELYPCKGGTCHNTLGSYECKCKFGTKGDGKSAAGCENVFPLAAQVIVGLSVGAVIFMALASFIVMKLQKRKHKKERDEYFHQNGGFQLYEEMRRRQVDTVHVLTEEEIKKATDNFDDDRVLGCGGRGMVYRGVLDDDKEVAIKKSKVINEEHREEFVNEIIILSQINHRNVVRLLGCCLEVDVPMLVYEFVSHGTLFEFLHGDNHISPISLDLRLKIATESAEALAYLHSSISRTILHGDVKTLNILLDDEYNAKVADFGASTLKSMDENEFIMFIKGTLGYLDPECFVSRQLTEKSDVYSFGVVLLELITRKKPIYTDSSNERKTLASVFLTMVRQGKLLDMLDNEIVGNVAIEVLQNISELAIHCLKPSGDERPIMKEVAERLQILRRLNKQLPGQMNPKRAEMTYGEPSVHVPYDTNTYRSAVTNTLLLSMDLALAR